MGFFHQFFSVNHQQLLDLLEKGDPSEMPDRIVQAIYDKFEWADETPQGVDFVRKACDKVFKQRQFQCENCGYIYFGLMLLCEHTDLPVDGWKIHYTEDVVSFVKGTSVPAYVKEIFGGLSKGRDPYFNLMDREVDSVVCCFIRAEEAKRLFDAIDACEDFEEGTIFNPDIEEIFFNDLLPAMDRKLPAEHCIAVFTL